MISTEQKEKTLLNLTNHLDFHCCDKIVDNLYCLKMILENLINNNGFVLYVVTDDKFLPKYLDSKSIRMLKDMVKSSADGGAKIFQYRAKKLDAYIQIRQADIVKNECEKNKMLFAVNDRADFAYILEAPILHVGQEDIPPKYIKSKFPQINIGFSTHNKDQVKKALEISDILDYISFGPVFGTKTKENPYPKTGIDDLRWAVRESNLPVVAIGGINYENLEEVLSSGVRAVAIISYILEDKKKIREKCEKIVKKAEKSVKKAFEKVQ